MKLGEQKDVNEFAAYVRYIVRVTSDAVCIGQLFDALETALKPTGKQQLLADTFRGQLMTQVLSRECSHTTERTEAFYMISLEVKNKSNLLQALDLFVEGSVLSPLATA